MSAATTLLIAVTVLARPGGGGGGHSSSSGHSSSGSSHSSSSSSSSHSSSSGHAASSYSPPSSAGSSFSGGSHSSFSHTFNPGPSPATVVPPINPFIPTHGFPNHTGETVPAFTTPPPPAVHGWGPPTGLQPPTAFEPPPSTVHGWGPPVWHAPPETTHGAVPVSPPVDGNVQTVPPPRNWYGYNDVVRPWGVVTEPWERQHHRYGYFSGSFVPSYGYGYSEVVGTGAACVNCGAGVVQERVPVASEPASLRVTVAAEAMPYLNDKTGLTADVLLSVEGERWGVALAAQTLTVKPDPTLDTWETTPKFDAHLTFAFLTGRYGRLRAEAGVDSVLAPGAVFFGPTLGLSGTFWLGGPVALEGAAMVTPFPFWQLDYRAGLVVGLGPLGIRAGWRTQVLDYRGLSTATEQRATYMGPYAGLALAL